MTELREDQVVQRVETSTGPPAPAYSEAPIYGAGQPLAAPPGPVTSGRAATTRRSSVTERVSQNETVRRIIALLFGVVQVLILLRFVLLLLGARGTNGIVQAIYNFSQIFVGPFEGIFHTDALHVTSGSTLELASITALVGLLIIEALVLAILKIINRAPSDSIG